MSKGAEWAGCIAVLIVVLLIMGGVGVLRDRFDLWFMRMAWEPTMEGMHTRLIVFWWSVIAAYLGGYAHGLWVRRKS